MELVIIGGAIIGLWLVVSFFSFVFKLLGALLVPGLVSALTWIGLHNRVSPQTTLFVVLVVFVITLIACGKRK